MKSLGLVTLLVMAMSFSLSFTQTACALDSSANLIAQVPAEQAQSTPPAEEAPAAQPATPAPASADKPHVSTPDGDPETTKLAGFRQFIEDQQNAHDKLIVDRFLLGVAVIFAVIAAALLFSLPPKPREQKE